MIKLSILIPTVEKHSNFLNKLLNELEPQMELYPGCVEVVIDRSEKDSRGVKRQRLIEKANGEYISFVDSDDRVCGSYISLLMEGINKGVDCCSLVGEITFDGKRPKKFIHSTKYNKWFEDDAAYYRGINHLNCIKTSIAKQIGFSVLNHGEDYDYSMRLMSSGLIKTTHEIFDTIYFYDFITQK